MRKRSMAAQLASDLTRAQRKASHDRMRFHLIARLAANELRIIQITQHAVGVNEILKTDIVLESDPEFVPAAQATHRDGPPPAKKAAAKKTDQRKGK